ncbi:hypothetical protein GCM10022403_099020 [Streptomyces coacervatus]|uniref:Uncharacterized protein n=1 Tax=Streptomyces coacervatus TaxID=647381 RepID=A0ABP7JQX5_9ACTN|nr:hypothetical protein [Streptomyces coacervatus]MDF2263861.1 hypothetical protein [Streptomyces coacervatus]
MILGNSLTAEAPVSSSKTNTTISPDGTIRLAITLHDGAIQHFEHPPAGTCTDWRVAELEALDSGFTFDEPVTEQWGHALTLIASNSLT